MADEFVLAGDIGGTKTHLAIFAKGESPQTPVKEHVFASADYDCLESMVSDFFEQSGLYPTKACFGVAGPVLKQRAKITKLPWVVDQLSLQNKFSFSKTHVINDLVATAYGLNILPDQDFIILKKGEEEKNGPRAVIAPGTGLGEAYMLHDGQGYKAYPSEGGHSLFGPADSTQLALLNYLADRGPIPYDLVCCGAGLVLIYDFVKDTMQINEIGWVAEKMAMAEDRAPIISEGALSAAASSPLCSKALEIYVSILAAEAANLALKIMSSGGVFFAGGIPPRITPFLSKDFPRLFVGNGPMRHVLETISVKAVLNPKTALLGAASLALQN